MPPSVTSLSNRSLARFRSFRRVFIIGTSSLLLVCTAWEKSSLTHVFVGAGQVLGSLQYFFFNLLGQELDYDRFADPMSSFNG